MRWFRRKPKERHEAKLVVRRGGTPQVSYFIDTAEAWKFVDDLLVSVDCRQVSIGYRIDRWDGDRWTFEGDGFTAARFDQLGAAAIL